MTVTYFKRYRMEIDLAGAERPPVDLPPGYALVGWDELLLPEHAAAKFQSFCWELDAHVFPCLGDYEGCRRLMREIANREGFVPEATWLVTYCPGSRAPVQPCGTVQGVRDGQHVGAIQNLGVVPGHRNKGLGQALMQAALEGFQQVGLERVLLEVTAQNTGAVALYERIGFRRTKIVYKAAQVAYA